MFISFAMKAVGTTFIVVGPPGTTLGSESFCYPVAVKNNNNTKKKKHLLLLLGFLKVE